MQPPEVQNWFPVHVSPQKRQSLSVPSGVPQPAAGAPQLPQPLIHVGVHAPLAHTGAPTTWAVPQVTLQAPQLATSLATLRSQPLLGTPSQSSHARSTQLGLQALFTQGLPPASTCAVEVLLQTLPQTPQLFTSVAPLIVQPFCGLPQESSVPVQFGVQMPERQLLPAEVVPVAEQAIRHVPQWALSVLRLTSQPVLGLPSQLSKPVAHEFRVQTLFRHCPLALGKSVLQLTLAPVHAPQ